MSLGTSDSHRLNNIDAIRLILAILVLFSHSYPLATGDECSEPLFVFSNGQITLGGLAVNCFFILSGYLITQSWERSQNAWSYLMKRFRRIYPGYLISVIICVFVVVPIASPDGLSVYSWNVVMDNSWRFMTLKGFRTPDAFLTNPAPLTVNGSLWSINYECWCYIGVMLLGLTRLLNRRQMILLLLLVSVVIHFIVEWFGLTPCGKFFGVIFGYPKLWSRLLPSFLSGAVIYLYRDVVVRRQAYALLALIGFVIAAIIPYGFIFAIPTLVAYLLYYMSYMSVIQWHTASKYGDFSYGMYLYAFPVQQLVMLAAGRPISPSLLFTLSLPPTLIISALSWHFVEKWFLKSNPMPSVPKLQQL